MLKVEQVVSLSRIETGMEIVYIQEATAGILSNGNSDESNQKVVLGGLFKRISGINNNAGLFPRGRVKRDLRIAIIMD